MSKRLAAINAFLQDTRWANWARTPLAGDASARRYWRLTNDDQSAILMDADPATGQETQRFADIGAWLRHQNLCAPKIYLHNADTGLMLIEDLGRTDFAQHLTKNPDDVATLYRAATDVLITLDQTPPPENLSAITPEVGGEMVTLTTEWYADRPNKTLAAEVTKHLHTHCSPPNVIALRDFHAENLIWRPTRNNQAKVGLLDFQDAVLAPCGYDLVSLLRDVRRDVDANVANQMITHFNAATGGRCSDAAFACLAVQRNLRILGVFARLALQDGKTRYVQWMPRIWDMILADLDHPALSTLNTCVRDLLPPPENASIRDIL